MKLLMENWRHFLNEGMKMPGDLPDGLQVRIGDFGDDMISFEIVDEETGKSPTKEKRLEKFGTVDGFMYIGKYKDKAGNKCLDAFEVRFVEAKGGFGPMLYDLAIEYATQNGGGLIADRYNVSDEAYSVWHKYNNMRDDVESIQLDNLENELTPDAEDNCIQKSSVRWSKIREIPWEDTATARIYRKNNLEMTNRLRKIGKLHDETSI